MPESGPVPRPIVYAGRTVIYSIRSTGNTNTANLHIYGRRDLLGNLKLFENILKAASALIASAMAIIKFIGIIGKIRQASV